MDTQLARHDLRPNATLPIVSQYATPSAQYTETVDFKSANCSDQIASSDGVAFVLSYHFIVEKSSIQLLSQFEIAAVESIHAVGNEAGRTIQQP